MIIKINDLFNRMKLLINGIAVWDIIYGTQNERFGVGFWYYRSMKPWIICHRCIAFTILIRGLRD